MKNLEKLLFVVLCLIYPTTLLGKESSLQNKNSIVVKTLVSEIKNCSAEKSRVTLNFSLTNNKEVPVIVQDFGFIYNDYEIRSISKEIKFRKRFQGFINVFTSLPIDLNLPPKESWYSIISPNSIKTFEKNIVISTQAMKSGRYRLKISILPWIFNKDINFEEIKTKWRKYGEPFNSPFVTTTEFVFKRDSVITACTEDFR